MDGLTASVCSACGRKKFLYTNPFPMRFKRKALRHAPDFAVTRELFGAPDLRVAARHILVTNRVYRRCVEMNWKDLIFEPIEPV